MIESITADENIQTTSDISILGRTIRFSVDLTQLISGSCQPTPYFVLNNIQWDVEICRTYYGDYVGVKINTFKNNDVFWSSDVEAIIKIMVDEKIVHKKFLEKKTYSNQNPSNTIEDFLPYVTFAGLAVDDEVNFEITFSASKSKVSTELGMHQIYTKFHMIFDPSNLDQNSIISPVVVVRGIKWRVEIETDSSGYYLAIFIVADKNDLDKTLSYKVTATISVLSLDSDKSVQPTFVENIRWSSNRLGSSEILDWIDLNEQNGFILEGEAHLVVTIDVDEPTTLWDIE